MPTISSATRTHKDKPCLNTDVLNMVTNTMNHKIVGFTVTYRGKTKVFDVDKKFDILKAWKQVEEWVKTLK